MFVGLYIYIDLFVVVVVVVFHENISLKSIKRSFSYILTYFEILTFTVTFVQYYTHFTKEMLLFTDT